MFIIFISTEFHRTFLFQIIRDRREHVRSAGAGQPRVRTDEELRKLAEFQQALPGFHKGREVRIS